MRLSEVWRTSTFRLSLLYGLLFTVGAVALLAMVYLQSAVYLTHRVEMPTAELRQTIEEERLINGRTSLFALFSADGAGRAGGERRPDRESSRWARSERLMYEVKTSSDTIAHDLDIARVTAELDEVLERFIAILRISELETRARSAGFDGRRPADHRAGQRPGRGCWRLCGSLYGVPTPSSCWRS